ncbi:beta-galactosidase GanA [Kribbella aluminosa]|uniref:beta-galactosidase n=1 Tax=Kribbella aluminosa TaxID=416017 RepID=A0ABS4UIX0_9ACTN|nr:beta-galactosidase [Kribbella aluminosa]MBP2351602.1 beta-galactosidase GanA [Kribbella aluminosa]
MSVKPIAPNGVFPFGTHVYREPHKDFETLQSDLPLLSRLGFNMIKIQESWAIDEPAEGRYEFARIVTLMEAAQREGLGVYLGLTMEQAPAWMWAKYPDAYMVDANNVPFVDPTQYCMPADAKPGPCWNHPGVRAAGEAFMGAVAARLGEFDNLWTWNTFQEVGFWNNLPKNPEFVGYCYCPHTIAAYRGWLQQRYESLAALNEAWFTAYTDWNHVDPPRRYRASPAMLDWRYYMENVYLAGVLEWKTDVLKASDPRSRPVFAHVGHPTVASGQEWRWAAAGDFFGSSNYPAWDPFDSWDDAWPQRESMDLTRLYELWHAMFFRNDLVRSATGRGRAFWGAEFQGGPISTFLHLGRTPSADDIRRWLLAGLAVGMHGISFWNHRAEHFWHEGNGFGLMDRTEGSSERIEEAGRIARAINRDPGLFVESEPPPAQVAVVVSEDTYQFMSGSRTNALEILQHNLRGHYARLWKLGVPVDFVEITLSEASDLSRYTVVILPFSPAIGTREAEVLTKYVAAGGTLISEASPGRHDNRGFATPSQMFDGAEKLFGATQTGFSLVDEPDDRRWTPPPRGAGEIRAALVCEAGADLAGNSVRANVYVQTLQPTTSTPILMADQEVVGVRNRYGDGTAILLGTVTGLSSTAHVHQPTDDFFGKMLAAAGVEPDRVGRLLRRRRVVADRQAWFLINPTSEAVTESVPLAGLRLEGDLLGDSVTSHTDDEITIKVAPYQLACLVVRDAG